MAQGPLTEESVQRVLADFPDPETGRRIATLGRDPSHRRPRGSGDREYQANQLLGAALEGNPAGVGRRSEGEAATAAEVTVNVVRHERPAEKIGEIGLTAKSVIAVGSGKGGRGQEHHRRLAGLRAVAGRLQVGLMDADVYGPSIPHLSARNERPRLVNQRIEPVDGRRADGDVDGLLVPADEAVIWRGPMLHGAITQFLRDTDWGDLDYLIIDMPPGTGDIALTLSQLLPLTGAVVVCTPQDVALLDAVKAIAMFRKVNIDVVGMVENMSLFVCPQCTARHEIFGSGGAPRRAAELNVPFLGEVPLNAQLRVLGDEGRVAAGLDDEKPGPTWKPWCTTWSAAWWPAAARPRPCRRYPYSAEWHRLPACVSGIKGKMPVLPEGLQAFIAKRLRAAEGRSPQRPFLVGIREVGSCRAVLQQPRPFAHRPSLDRRFVAPPHSMSACGGRQHSVATTTQRGRGPDGMNLPLATFWRPSSWPPSWSPSSQLSSWALLRCSPATTMKCTRRADWDRAPFKSLGIVGSTVILAVTHPRPICRWASCCSAMRPGS